MKNYLAKLYICFAVTFSATAYSDAFDYIYPNQGPSYSNYGTIGLLSNPTARFHPGGTFGFTWNKMNPYLRGNVMAYPFDWFEAAYGYTDLNNELYSDVFAFSGNQTLKDKGFDAKFRLVKESQKIPAIALGFRDMAGTGLFSAEYLVASKQIKNFDFSLGLGWGMLTENAIKNPLSVLHSGFKQARTKKAGTEGGEFSIDKWFRGDAGIFSGVEIYLPYMNGARLKIEYDGVDYKKEGFPPVSQDSKVNIGVVYPLNKHFSLRAGVIRGNTLNIGFEFKGSFGGKNPLIPKNDSHKPIENADIIKRLNSSNDMYLYKTTISNLNKRGLFLQAAHLDEENQTYEAAYSSSKHLSWTRATGRVARVLNEITPDRIKTLKITNLNANLGMHTVEIDRDKFTRYYPEAIPEVLLDEFSIKPILYDKKKYSFQPTESFPKLIGSIHPELRSQIGGPDGFFFGDLRVGATGELLIGNNVTFNGNFSAGIYNNMNTLKLGSDSVLPHVRSDIVKYLKATEKFAITRLQMNYYQGIRENLYGKFTVGILEHMFGGVGYELLYRDFYKNWSLGTEIFHVKQRDFDQMLDFQDYSTTTGFINFFYDHQASGVLVKLKAGRFLAKDDGIHLNLSKRFKSGARVGGFVTMTDVSRETFGEGSFDKGFFFYIPIESFFTNHSRGMTGFGLRPITRDGGALLQNAFSLFAVTDQGSASTILRDWDDIYD
jgi:hypothetical protein